MKKTLRYVINLVLALSLVSANAQKGKVRSVQDDYRGFAYIKTSDVLLEIAEDGYQNKEILEQLANSFYFMNNMEAAVKWYGELFKLSEEVDPENFFRYAMALKGVENYKASDEWMKKFNANKPSDSRGKAFLSKADYKNVIEKAGNDFIDVKNLAINTEYSDFGTTEINGAIVFASSRGSGRKYRWNEQPYLDLYVSKNDSGEFTSASEFDSNINTKYHESSVAYTPDEKSMFFTRNNYHKRYYVEDDEGINRLQLYRATLNNDNEWDNVTPVHFNSKDYSVAHPTINLDGTRLYFASDMPGTLGQSDIYVVDINKDGSLGTPKNLGPSINTEGKESFPHVSTNGDLYFSTDGFPGLGGLDIFVSEGLDKKMGKSSMQSFIVKNVGEPINSNADDFAYYENIVTKKGFFSSNRTGGKGDDDIYSFTIAECQQLVEGLVRDRDTDALLSGTTVILFDNEGIEIERMTVGEDAQFSFNLECEKEYLVRGEKDKYSSDEKRFTTPKRKQDLKLQILLKKDEQEVKPCDDLAKVLDIPIIYFDFDKYNIRYNAEIELQKVLAVLNKYPSMTIDIRSHTDCRATYSYNDALSDNRAKSTRQYLIDNGIAPARLTAKGYGESQLVNNCACEPNNESGCSEAEHQKNRRSEFIITSFKGQKCIDN